jgi:hypothetical protein
MRRKRNASPRPRLLVFNQYYWPGVEATAHLLSSLCEGLAEDFEITVITGKLRDFPDSPARERRNGVEIVRVASTAFDRAQLLLRGSNYVTYLASSLQAGLGAERRRRRPSSSSSSVVGRRRWFKPSRLQVGSQLPQPVPVHSDSVEPKGDAQELVRLVAWS